jgi:SNF2 family DNA or RNA helicase
MNDPYQMFLNNRAQYGAQNGFEPEWMPEFLYGFQKHLMTWALRKGRCAMFADCGLGKTPMALVWAKNVALKTGKAVLILTPLAVSHQFVREGEKFGICVERFNGRKSCSSIIVTNYEKLHHFRASDWGGVVCDESSILKNFSGVTRKAITEFLRTIPYRLLETATAAPNDYIEFGTSSEALGEMGYMDMLARFFKHDSGASSNRVFRNKFGGSAQQNKWRFRGYAEQDFWRWLVSWAKALRKPSDIGFDDYGFALEPITYEQYVVKARTHSEGMLFDLSACTLEEQRHERRRTINERCEKAAEIANTSTEPIVAWCSLNDEGSLLKKLIPDAVEVTGSDADEKKEEAFAAFESGSVRVLVTKPVIGGFGLNWQHCARQIFFPSHSFEQWYQAIRRSWRFGQKNKVRVDVITSEGESRMLENLQRKAAAADKMFSNVIALMNNPLKLHRANILSNKEQVPEWL